MYSLQWKDVSNSNKNSEEQLSLFLQVQHVYISKVATIAFRNLFIINKSSFSHATAKELLSKYAFGYGWSRLVSPI